MVNGNERKTGALPLKFRGFVFLFFMWAKKNREASPTLINCPQRLWCKKHIRFIRNQQRGVNVELRGTKILLDLVHQKSVTDIFDILMEGQQRDATIHRDVPEEMLAEAASAALL